MSSKWIERAGTKPKRKPDEAKRNRQRPKERLEITSKHHAASAGAKHRMVTDEEAARFAMARYAPLNSGRTPKTLERLKIQFNRNPNVIQANIVRAFKKGLVEVVSTMPPTIEQSEELQIQILQKYRNIRNAIVIETDTTVGDTVGDGAARKKREPESEKIQDDEIHRKVGHAMATRIDDWQIRDKDRLGLGSGRSVYYTVEAATRMRPQIHVSARGLHLISLTGAVDARDYAKRVNARMDSDFHVGMFGSLIEGTATLHLTSRPVSEVSYRQLSCLGASQWAECKPTHALVGVGVLAEGHRFFDQVEQTATRQADADPIYGKIIQPLRDLVDNCKEFYGSHKFYPVADICNHLMLIEAPELAYGIRKRMEKQIETVNSSLLNVRADQLSDVEHLLLVAAGKRKARALNQILMNPAFKIKMICIDRSLAEELLTLRDPN